MSEQVVLADQESIDKEREIDRLRDEQAKLLAELILDFYQDWKGREWKKPSRTSGSQTQSK